MLQQKIAAGPSCVGSRYFYFISCHVWKNDDPQNFCMDGSDRCLLLACQTGFRLVSDQFQTHFRLLSDFSRCAFTGQEMKLRGKLYLWRKARYSCGISGSKQNRSQESQGIGPERSATVRQEAVKIQAKRCLCGPESVRKALTWSESSQPLVVKEGEGKDSSFERFRPVSDLF